MLDLTETERKALASARQHIMDAADIVQHLPYDPTLTALALQIEDLLTAMADTINQT
jgi:hypothetical protein